MDHFLAPSLLITDDDRDFRETLQGVFEPLGFQTHLAGDGEEALEIVAHTIVHVALFDMHMPRLTGLETIERLREMGRDLPCILISANLTDEIRQRAQAFRVLSKPVRVHEVRATVAAAIEATYGPRS
ncbi:MAG: response regulator [Pirellulales bacterium]